MCVYLCAHHVRAQISAANWRLMLIGLIMATSFRQPRDQLDKLGDQIEGVMKCAVNVADHMQVIGSLASGLV